MPLIQDHTPSDKIKKAYGIKETNLLATISGEIVPVVIIDDLSDVAVETPALCSDVRAAGGAGTFNTWRLANPAGSGVIVKITQIQVTTPNAAIALRWNLTDLVVLANTPLTTFWIDRRQPGFPAAVFGHDIPLAVIAATGWDSESVLNKVLLDILKTPVLLVPGDQLTFQDKAANTAGGVSFWWTERPITPTD